MCQAQVDAARNASPQRAIYAGDWPAESRAIREAEPWCHWPACPVDGVDQLTVDHPTRAPLCRSHHATLENRRRGGVPVPVLA